MRDRPRVAGAAQAVVAAGVENDDVEFIPRRGHGIDDIDRIDRALLDVAFAGKTVADGDEVVLAADLRAMPGIIEQAHGAAGLERFAESADRLRHGAAVRVDLEDDVEAGVAQDGRHVGRVICGIGQRTERICALPITSAVRGSAADASGPTARAKGASKSQKNRARKIIMGILTGVIGCRGGFMAPYRRGEKQDFAAVRVRQSGDRPGAAERRCFSRTSPCSGTGRLHMANYSIAARRHNIGREMERRPGWPKAEPERLPQWTPVSARENAAEQRGRAPFRFIRKRR